MVLLINNIGFYTTACVLLEIQPFKGLHLDLCIVCTYIHSVLLLHIA